MKEITPLANRIARVVMTAMSLCTSLACVYGIGSLLAESQTIGAWYVILFAVGWIFVYAVTMHEAARIWLTEEGVWVCFVFRKRFFRWREFVQAGIEVRQLGKGDPVWFVLLLPGGSPRRYRDKTFFLRNPWKILRLPNKPEIKDFVIHHYGPLDFDLSDGQNETSVVEDMNLFQK